MGNQTLMGGTPALRTTTIQRRRKVVAFSNPTTCVAGPMMNLSPDLGMDPSRRANWSKHIHQRMLDVIKKKKSSEKIAALHKVEPDLQVPWNYSNPTQERKAREDLLVLWRFLLHEVPNTATCSYLDRPTFFKAMAFICRRQEFDLTKITWSSDMKPTVPTIDTKNFMAYHETLHETIDFCISNLAKAGVYTSVIDFSGKMLAINYFHYSKLADMIADSIWPAEKHSAAKAQDKQLAKDIKELTKPKPGLYSEASVSLEIFDKMPARFAALETNTVVKAFGVKKPKQAWMKRFEEDGSNFHRFLTDLFTHVLYLFGENRDKIEWTMLPHYHKLVSALLFQLKYKLDVPQWRKKQVTECLCMFLHNGKLVNLFIKTLYARTNAYDVAVTEAALDILADWFKGMLYAHGRLPKEFDHNQFLAGLNVLFDSDHHVVLAKSLILVYNYNELFLGKARAALIKDLLLNRHFWRLFLHWNVDIRDVYIQLVVYKMVRVEGQHELLDSNAKREIRLDKTVSEELSRRIELLKERVDWENRKAEYILAFEETSKQHIIKTRGLKKRGRSSRMDPDLDDTLTAVADKKDKKEDGHAKPAKGARANAEDTSAGKKHDGEDKTGHSKGKDSKTKRWAGFWKEEKPGKSDGDSNGKGHSTGDPRQPKGHGKKGSERDHGKDDKKKPDNEEKGKGKVEKGHGDKGEKGKGGGKENGEKHHKEDDKENKGEKEKPHGGKHETDTGEKEPTEKGDQKHDKKQATRERRSNGDEQPSEIPYGLEVYAPIALYKYETYVRELQDFLRNPYRNEKGIIQFPAMKYQGLVMAGMGG